MGMRMMDKYYKYWGDNNSEKPGEQLNLVIFFCVAIDPRYKLSDYTKMLLLKCLDMR
uniref:hAT-like transposase RNase-H fold domain-containing protein n=1 Tax=Arundo donax TaxID=35708 RepID=A0A0A9GVY6_ARUDO